MAPARHLYVESHVAPSGVSDRPGGQSDRGGRAPAHARGASLQRPMSHTRRISVLLAVALSLAVAGCGGDAEGKPIPAASATALNNELDGVQRRLDDGSSGACQDILTGPRGPNMARV